MTAMEMRSKARRWKAENGLDLIIVDYLQLMQGSSKRASDNRQQEMSEISRSLKGLARELNVPVIASVSSAAVLSRGPASGRCSATFVNQEPSNRMPILSASSIVTIL